MKVTFIIRIVFFACILFSRNVLSADEIAPIDCMIEPNVFVELSSSVPGVLGSLSIDKSDLVKKNQVIATLKSELEQVEVKASKQRLKLSQSEHGRMGELYASNVITQSEKDQSDNDRKLAELELIHAQTNLALRQIKSPIDGVVVKRYFTPGEFVANKPIVKLAQLHPLRIEVVSPVKNYGKIVKGMLAKIQPDFGDYKELIAEVVVVDKVVDAASGTFGVRLELDNKDHAIPGGLKCKVNFMLEPVIAEDSSNTKASSNVLAGKAVLGEADVFSDALVTDEAMMCLSIGPYKKQEKLKKILSTLETEIIQKKLRTKKTTRTNFLVSSSAINTYGEAKQYLQEMNSAGLSDVAILNNKGRYYIAAGIYDRKSMATSRANTLQDKGFSVMVKQRVVDATRYWADLTYLQKHDDKFSTSVPDDKGMVCDKSTRLSLLHTAQK